MMFRARLSEGISRSFVRGKESRREIKGVGARCLVGEDSERSNERKSFSWFRGVLPVFKPQLFSWSLLIEWKGMSVESRYYLPIVFAWPIYLRESRSDLKDSYSSSKEKMSSEPIVEDNISEEIILETVDEVPYGNVQANVGLNENDDVVEENKVVEGDVVGKCEQKEDANPIAIKKRKKTSSIWDKFKEVKFGNGQKKEECIHCKRALAIGNTGSTTQFKHHLDRSAARIRFIKNQKEEEDDDEIEIPIPCT
ncbi:hypothetical protein M5K25_010637 [Dendrobium thyrsiflorum]|uniref:BED-type domain-containing protein n=1 Tax=Dendrobium thyrsiflorum TaxID=117978 RepID=A0ABD0V054_DENTH